MDRSDNENTTPTHTINPWCEHDAIFLSGGGGSSPIFENDATCLKSREHGNIPYIEILVRAKLIGRIGRAYIILYSNQETVSQGGGVWRDNLVYI